MSTNLTTSYSYLNELNNNLAKYFLIIETAFGISGNLLSIVVFSRLIHQKTNMSFLYIIQSIIDLHVIVVSLLLYRSPTLVSRAELYKMNDALCKSWAYLRRLFTHMSSWMLVLTAFDRFTFVIYENRRFKFMRSKRVLVVIILVTFVLIAIADLENLFYSISYQQVANPCNSYYAVILSSDIISILLRTYIPMVLMFVFNTMMLRKIFESSRATFNQTSRSRKELQFTISVMSFDLIFFITKFPLSIYFIVYDIDLYSNVLSSDIYLGLVYNLIYTIILNVSFFDVTFSFFTNLGFNKLFRKEFFALFSFLPFVKSITGHSASGEISHRQHELSVNVSAIQQLRVPGKSCLKTHTQQQSGRL